MSEKRKKTESPRPAKTKFKVKAKRSSTSQESANTNIENIMINGETTPKRYSSHSTPIRNSSITNNAEDSPEMDYRGSPIMGFPCTQQNEVIWSWNSPKEGTNSSNDLKTPKRSSNFNKRRIADSPLMFASLKVRHKKQEANVDQFIADFLKFNNQITVEEPEPVPSTSNLPTEEELKPNLDDKSIDDEFLEKCSQLAEDEFWANYEKEQETANSIKIEESKFHKSHEKITGLEDLMKTPIDTTKKPTKRKQEKTLAIPDDSFDECLSQFVEEYKTESPVRPAFSRLNKLAPKKSLFSNENGDKCEAPKSCSTLEVKKPNLNTSLVKNKSFDCFGKNCALQGKLGHKSKLEQNCALPGTLGNKIVNPVEKPKFDPSPRKFFKSKSNSEPFSKDPKPSVPIKKPVDAYSFVSNSQIERKIIGKSIKCKIFSDSSLNQTVYNVSQSPEDSGNSSSGNNFNNVPMSNPRFVERVGVKDKKADSTQEILCTAEEIERKRIEAKMKLEAKRRLQTSKLQNSKFQTTTRILPVAQSIKR